MRPRRELADRVALQVGHVQVADGVERQATGSVSPEAKVPFDAPVGANSLTVLVPTLATYRLPPESNARPSGRSAPRRRSP